MLDKSKQKQVISSEGKLFCLETKDLLIEKQASYVNKHLTLDKSKQKQVKKERRKKSKFSFMQRIYRWINKRQQHTKM